jgi:esterase/lipase
LLAKETRTRLELVRCPVLAVYSPADDAIPCRKIANLISQKIVAPVEIAWFNSCGHTMPLDIQGTEISSRIVDFSGRFTR